MYTCTCTVKASVCVYVEKAIDPDLLNQTWGTANAGPTYRSSLQLFGNIKPCTVSSQREPWIKLIFRHFFFHIHKY